MKKFASHRLYIPHQNLFLKNQVIEVMEETGEVLAYSPFTEEISFTEWLGGLIVVSNVKPSVISGDGNSILELYIDESKNIRRVSSVKLEDTPLYAYHISGFNVADMCFSENSRVLQLY